MESTSHLSLNYLKILDGGTWLARSVQHETLDLRVVCSSPTPGVEITLKKYF